MSSINSKIKVLIPSYKRGTTISTHKLFQDCDLFEVHIAIHNDDLEYFQNDSINENCTIHVTYEPTSNEGITSGLVNQRNWLVQHLLDEGEWALMADDNIEKFTNVEKDFYDKQELPVEEDNSNVYWNKIYGHTSTPEELHELLTKDIYLANQIKANVIGFATTPNPFFRTRKYRTIGYCLGKSFLIKRTDFRWDKGIRAMEDYQLSAEQILRYGKVLLNNYIKPIAKHYQEGGIGTYSARLPKKIQDCIYLKQKYPGFFRYKTKKGKHPYAELQVAFNSEKQIEKWRFFMKKVLNNGK